MIESITDAKNTGTFPGGDVTKADAQILAAALEHGLVSDLTSLVAVDVTPVRDVKSGERLDPLLVPTGLPVGVMPHGGTDGPMTLLLGLALLALAGIMISRERSFA